MWDLQKHSFKENCQGKNGMYRGGADKSKVFSEIFKKDKKEKRQTWPYRMSHLVQQEKEASKSMICSTIHQ